MEATKSDPCIQVVVRQQVALIILNRPEKRNALNSAMIHELLKAFNTINSMDHVRVVRIQSAGDTFSAGADIHWMLASKDLVEEENLAECRLLADLFEAVNKCSKVVVATIQGACYGGAIGLIAVCDFVLASNLAHFAFGEVKLGLIPATIAPYVIHRIGAGKAKQLMLLGNSFSAEEALALGLVDERIQPQNMDAAFDRLKDAIVQGGAHAQKGIKQLMGQLNAPDVNPDLKELTARVIAASRISDEAQEGLQAFLERRKPQWS